MAVTLPPPLTADTDDAAVALLEQYYGHTYLGADCYTGAFFDSWAPQNYIADSNRFTADDLVAITFLSVAVKVGAARQLLVTRAARFTELLDAVGPDRDLVDEAEQLTPDAPILLLEDELRAVTDVGRTIATKLMARKRPRLVPIYDVVVGRVLNTVAVHRDPIREALRADDGALHTRLLTIRSKAGLPDHISALRVLDVICWMYGTAH
ncbi:hypothetical protein HQ346_16670 [Rhodococcus sp. BP-252]|uniref:DUF6308 family protein n=1 Tax=unclassified Rhodococcus (in: high G+C Gram-positive bacteria) TaxID=192944 RepID=UPI001C9B45A6|nr:MULTISPECIES: DUF6308 family protein [unclassified Rhodococcus (in: high G+C Gram-positive bacteria)]MBY6413330.1 hypothetical protein [Rhodococcus sp. BP-320]MBY6418066.1 hypothetical protein [Rhodococcus sp. BP-321]MBY6422244.1 hypothetical protein [Rhodococcus sp. BP-324]MBY6428115.1 hypothetical protein [Rhodococcus sp. BP-323]MBY6433251.1 hypothetical protein [Rhodococcus sp. BP-322]